MQPGLLKLDPITTSRFQGSDGRLEIEVPAGAVTSTDLAAAGGQLSLSIKQIAPASGGTGGGSGRYSFGIYLIQTINGQKKEWSQALRKPLTFKLRVSPEEYAVDVQHAVLVFNGELPADTNFYPDSSGPMVSAAQAHITPASAVKAAFDASTGFLSATVFMPSDPVMAFNTDSPVATFGKPDIFSADLSAGALTGGYPIEVPAGPAGFKPPLALNYSSAAVNEQHNPQGAAGWVGEGWNLSLGSISWAEHNVAESVGTNWQNSWMLNDAFGTSAELIPPTTGVTTFCGIGTNSAPTPPPVVWHTSPENHAKVIEIAGSSSLTCGAALRTLPCFRAFLPNGVMEEFGCTPWSLQWYPLANGAYAINQWNLDLIQDPKGNQIRINYGDDLVASNRGYPRDIAISSIEWGTPGCTASSCALKRVSFEATNSVAHAAGATCASGGTPRCDDPQDLSGSGGMAAPLIQNTYVLNDIKVQVRAISTDQWSTLRQYQLSYEQTGPGQIRDPATGLLESVAGHLTLTKIVEIGTDGGQLPTRSFGYQLITNYYEDDFYPAAGPSYCPGWVPNGRLCSQSYGGNSYYLASATNGLGLSQSFGWSLARNNTFVGRTDPFYCDTTTANNCTLADDQNWSRVVLTSESDSTAGRASASTTTYSYALANFVAQTCPQCTVGYTWGNQKDGDYSDYYNGKFMGFAQVTVTHPDLSVETHYYHSSLGWGVYNCQPQDPNAVPCGAGTAYCYNPCNPDAWWMGATVNNRLTINALHGREQEADYYDKRSSLTDPLVLLRKVTTSYLFNGATTGCLPAGVSASPPTRWGNWDLQLVSELDPSNPVALCDPQTQTVTTSTYDGTNPTAVPQTTSTYAYDQYGRVTSDKLTSSNGTGGTATTIFHKPTYQTNDSVTSTCTDPLSCHYLVNLEIFNDTEDSAGAKKACTYTTYDTSFRAEVTRVDRYTDCTQLDSADGISDGLRLRLEWKPHRHPRS
ncbi:MAG: hypothetical protein M3Z28_06040 [Candidatus Dormibacteraeota bacterium]|nr:hypothetical protein [Candidatus Dormibacteraeota bacterium]